MFLAEIDVFYMYVVNGNAGRRTLIKFDRKQTGGIAEIIGFE